MAGKKISELPTGTQVSGPELFPAVQSGTTKKFSLSTVAAWIRSAITPSSIGAQPTITANGILKGDGAGGVSAATAGTDYGTYSKPSGGIPASDLANGVIPSVPSAYTSNPAMDGTASPGSSGAWARGDHVHPTDSTKAAKADLTSIQATGTTNTTGAAIPAGAYFYLNWVLHRAKTQIDANATFTVNTNCEQVTVGKYLIHEKAFTGTTGTYGEIGQALEAGHNLIGVRLTKVGTNVPTNTAVTIYAYVGEMRGFYISQVVQGTRVANTAVEATLYYI